jgi:hypothetical protein
VPRISAKIIRSYLGNGWFGCCCHDLSIGCDGCDGLDKTLANSCGEQLAENPDVLALHSPALGRRGRGSHLALRPPAAMSIPAAISACAKTKITILAYPLSESQLLGHPGLWSTSLLQRRITLSQPSISTGPPTRPVPQPSPSPIYRRPRPKRFGWFAMIIAVVGRFLIGAAVVAFGTEGTAGKAAPITPVRETAQSTSGQRS